MMFRHWLVCFALAGMLIASSGSLHADLWYEHYAAADQALAEEDWTEVIDQVNEALERRGDSGARIRTYGMRFTAYFPYLKLGIAYYHLDQLEAALQAFETEERLGAIAESAEDQVDLERYRTLVQSALQEQDKETISRIRGIVRESLDEAHTLESAGRLEEAVAAVGRALAVKPDEPEALATQQRLRVALAARQDEQDLVERVSMLTARGKELLEEGRFSEAAATFRRVLSLSPSGEVQDLLDTTQRRLREEIGAQQQKEQLGLVAAQIAEARTLVESGRGGEALEKLQLVLAVEPDHAEALALQTRALEAQDKADRQSRRTQRVESILADGQQALATGSYEDAMSSANQVLALDSGNATALEQLATAYRSLNRLLLGSAPRQNFPPAIRFVDLRTEQDDGTLAQRVESPDFQLSGVVIDDSPVEILFSENDTPTSSGTTSSQQIGDLYITEFRLPLELEAGATTLRLTAADENQSTSSSEYVVAYARPWFRSPWMWPGLAALAVLGTAGALNERARRRRRRRQRRFNPYVAGAPVLNEKSFFGRERLIDRILQSIHNNSLLLYGERRIGKTSVQHQLKKRLQEMEDPQYDFYPVYIDLQGTPEDRFFQTLAEEIFDELSPVLGATVPEWPDPGGGGYTYRHLVRDLRAVIKTLEARSRKSARLVLLIDEVDELNQYDPRINQRLRSLFMKSFAESLVAVVSGVRIKRQWEMEGSPWYNFFEEIEIRGFEEKDARELIEKPIQGVIEIEPRAVEGILAHTEARPYLIQKMCMGLVNRAYEQSRTTITADDVEVIAGPEAT